MRRAIIKQRPNANLNKVREIERDGERWQWTNECEINHGYATKRKVRPDSLSRTKAKPTQWHYYFEMATSIDDFRPSFSFYSLFQGSVSFSMFITHPYFSFSLSLLRHNHIETTNHDPALLLLLLR